jgi:predicted nucleotidyltransferase
MADDVMLSKEQIRNILHEQYPYLIREYGVKRIGFFGSYVRGTAKEQSDVDIIAEFERPIGLKFMAFSEYLEKLFGTSVDILTPEGLRGIRNPRVAQNIQETIEYV